MFHDAMSRFRRFQANALIALLAGGSLFTIAFDIDRFWPFSTYQMFALAAPRPALMSYWLVGVAADGRRISLMRNELLWPLDPARFTAGVRQLLPFPDRLQRALEDVLARYNRRVCEGDLPGPPLVEVRLSLAQWWLGGGPEPVRELSPDADTLVARARVAPAP